MLILALFFLIVGGEDAWSPYNITRFKSQEGIYFDDVGQQNLYSSEWNLLIYYDLSTYWTEFCGLKKSVRKLSELCNGAIKEDISQHLSSVTIVQPHHHILESKHINEAFYQQNEKTSTRILLYS